MRARRTTPATSLNAGSGPTKPALALTCKEMKAVATIYLQTGPGNPTEINSRQTCSFSEETRESADGVGVGRRPMECVEAMAVWGPASPARAHGRVATSGSSREGGVAELCKYLLQPRFQPAVDRDEVAA